MDKNIFAEEIKRLMKEAKDRGEAYLEVSAGGIHRHIGGYPGKDQKIMMCCDVMYELKEDIDEIIQLPHGGKGATLKIRYYL